MTGKQQLLKRQKLRNNEYYFCYAENLIILHKNVHKLVYATQRDTISAILQNLQLNLAELKKLNKLRALAGNEAIQFEQSTISCC